MDGLLDIQEIVEINEDFVERRQNKEIKKNHKRKLERNRKQNFNSKVFKSIVFFLHCKMHPHMLRFCNKEKTKFEVTMVNKKSPKWSRQCISLFEALDYKLNQKKGNINRKGKKYDEQTKGRFRANMKKLEGKYIKEDKDSHVKESKSVKRLIYEIVCPKYLGRLRNNPKENNNLDLSIYDSGSGSTSSEDEIEQDQEKNSIFSTINEELSALKITGEVIQQSPQNFHVYDTQHSVPVYTTLQNVSIVIENQEMYPQRLLQPPLEKYQANNDPMMDKKEIFRTFAENQFTPNCLIIDPSNDGEGSSMNPMRNVLLNDLSEKYENYEDIEALWKNADESKIYMESKGMYGNSNEQSGRDIEIEGRYGNSNKQSGSDIGNKEMCRNSNEQSDMEIGGNEYGNLNEGIDIEDIFGLTLIEDENFGGQLFEDIDIKNGDYENPSHCLEWDNISMDNIMDLGSLMTGSLEQNRE